LSSIEQELFTNKEAEKGNKASKQEIYSENDTVYNPSKGREISTKFSFFASFSECSMLYYDVDY